MDFKDHIPAVNNKAKIASVLSVVLIVGFLASNAPTLEGAPGNQAYTQKLDPAATSNLGHSPARNGGEGTTEDTTSSSSGSDRKVITTVRTTLEVSDVASAMTLIESDVESYNGFIESSSVSRGESNTGSMTVAVPADSLEEFENGLSDNWKVESRNVNREDVTDSYNELEAEIESLQTEYNRLQELMNQTDDVENLIRIQERMSQVRSQIDYKQERLDRMDENIEYSKVHITLEGPETFESRFGLRDTLSNAYSALFRSVELIIIGTAYLIPVGVLYGLYRIGIRVKQRRF